MVRSRTIIATPPGATIKEQLDDRKMSQKELSARMEMSEKHISRLINGEVQLTPDVALRLESVLGLPASFWCNLESIYREKLLRIKAENELDEDIEIIKSIPYNEMVKQGWIEPTRKLADRVFNLRKFFEVVRLGNLNGSFMPRIAARKLGNSRKSDYALLVSAQKAKIDARSIQTAPISIERLKRILPMIRSMTTQDPSVFYSNLCQELANCGVALVLLPHIGGSYLHGTTFMDGAKIVIGMTVRGKDADRFWFSLFHEIGHIVLGHLVRNTDDESEIELEADTFAKSTLIPDEAFNELTASGSFTRKSISDFAVRVGIDAGIVVGRLQKEGFLNYRDYNDLKTKYEMIA